MGLKGTVSGKSSALGNASVKNVGNVFSGTTDGYWKQGLSAYEVAVAEGFVGSKSEWLASLNGKSIAIASIQDDGNIITITFSDGNVVSVRHGAATEFTVSSDNKIYWKYTNSDQWNELVNIQSIINDALAHGQANYAKIYYGTTADWNTQRSLVSELCSFYVYTDFNSSVDEEGNISYKPAIKIGDGQAYLIDLPFIGSDFTEILTRIESHIDNGSIHVSDEDRLFWNEKCRVDESAVSDEHIIFTIY